MNMQSLRPAKEWAIQYGCKAVVYGPPGSAKTPLINTAPRPVLLICEPGMLSMRNSNVPSFEAFDAAKVNEFFDWLFNSAETKNFDTIAIDSISQMAEIFLQKALKDNKHGLKAYGEMATNTMAHLRGLFHTRYKHTYLIAKEIIIDSDGFKLKKPYFPGQQLPQDIPHLYDMILNLGIYNVPGMGQTRAFRCQGTMDVVARDRTGTLNEFEPPNFAALVAKAMA